MVDYAQWIVDLSTPHLGGSQSHTDAGDHKALLSDPVHASTPPSAHYATHPTQTFFRSNMSLTNIMLD